MFDYGLLSRLMCSGKTWHILFEAVLGQMGLLVWV